MKILGSSKLTKESITAMSSLIKNSDTLVTLAISDNNLESEGIIELALALQDNKSITSLNIGFIYFMRSQ